MNASSTPNVEPTPNNRTDPPSSAREQYQRRVGQVVGGKWSITTLIGIGGMAVVYEAMHKNGKRLAIKVLKRELADHPEAKDRFLAEGYRANSVEHPAVVHALDDGVTADGLPFLVMDRLHGESLDQRMKRAPLSELEALVVADRVLSALTVAEQAGITHRDLKPDNFFLTTEREIKLLDFGIAKATGGGPNGGTEIGSIMGTPAYMAPEQASGQWDKVDGRSDIFSVGAAMMALLVGRSPREGETVNFVLVSAMRDPLPSMASLRADLHPLVAALVDRAVAPDREMRFQSAEEMRVAIAHAWAELSMVPLVVAHAALFQGGVDSLRRSSSAPSFGNVRLPTNPSASGPTGTAYIGTGSHPSGPHAVAPAQISGAYPHHARSHYPSAPPQAMSVIASAPRKRSIVPALAGVIALLLAAGVGGGVIIMKRAADAQGARAFGQVSSVTQLGAAPPPASSGPAAPTAFSDLPALPVATVATAAPSARGEPQAADSAAPPLSATGDATAQGKPRSATTASAAAAPSWLSTAMSASAKPASATPPSRTQTQTQPRTQTQAGGADPFERRF